VWVIKFVYVCVSLSPSACVGQQLVRPAASLTTTAATDGRPPKRRRRQLLAVIAHPRARRWRPLTHLPDSCKIRSPLLRHTLRRHTKPRRRRRQWPMQINQSINQSIWSSRRGWRAGRLAAKVVARQWRAGLHSWRRCCWRVAQSRLACVRAGRGAGLGPASRPAGSWRAPHLCVARLKLGRVAARATCRWASAAADSTRLRQAWTRPRRRAGQTVGALNFTPRLIMQINSQPPALLRPPGSSGGLVTATKSRPSSDRRRPAGRPGLVA
jgi:hypothetical protein